jgi:hypothetical protein
MTEVLRKMQQEARIRTRATRKKNRRAMVTTENDSDEILTLTGFASCEISCREDTARVHRQLAGVH